MKTAEFQQQIRVTAVCMRILIIAKKGCGHLSSNDTYFADIWFCAVKTDEEAIA